MEAPNLRDKPAMDYHSNVDTSRPFRSVKEAVAILGEKILVGEIHSPKPFTFPKQETPCYSPSPRISQEPSSQKSSDSNDHTLVDALKKLEAELEETKMELKQLKERETETEVALASLNAELHKNMSKLAQNEAAAAATAMAGMASRSRTHWEIEEDEIKEEKKKDLLKRMETSSTLAEILTIGEKEGLFGARKREKKVMKKKPIIPLMGDLFSRKKGSSTTMHNPLFAYSLN